MILMNQLDDTSLHRLSEQEWVSELKLAGIYISEDDMHRIKNCLDVCEYDLLWDVANKQMYRLDCQSDEIDSYSINEAWDFLYDVLYDENNSMLEYCCAISGIFIPADRGLPEITVQNTYDILSTAVKEMDTDKNDDDNDLSSFIGYLRILEDSSGPHDVLTEPSQALMLLNTLENRYSSCNHEVYHNLSSDDKLKLLFGSDNEHLTTKATGVFR